MLLSRLAEGFDVRGPGDPDISGLSEDSRRITSGMLFVAVPGSAQDGHAYVAIDGDLTPEQLEQARQAELGCPERAITVEE